VHDDYRPISILDRLLGLVLSMTTYTWTPGHFLVMTATGKVSLQLLFLRHWPIKGFPMMSCLFGHKFMDTAMPLADEY